MGIQEEINYQRIAEAITYIRKNFKEQPTLEQVAEQVHLSPAHFQRMFTDWAGTSPKKFLQYISVEHAKRLLRNDIPTGLWDTTVDTGLSSTSRLHELFVRIEGMTPAEYRDGGKSLQIRYSFDTSPFGNLIVASTEKGICYMAFAGERDAALQELKSRYPQARLGEQRDIMQEQALFIFQHDWSRIEEIKLHLKGTEFQLKVWESLLRIPLGKLTTYGQIAQQIGHPGASRAVGTAIGSNPIAYLIPCHRVIQSGGHFGGYMWGSTRKAAIIGWEAAQQEAQESYSEKEH